MSNLLDNSTHKVLNNLNSNAPLDIRQLMSYLPSSQWYFYKDVHSTYQGCNQTFSKIVGAGNPDNIEGMKVSDLKYLNNKILSNNAKEFEEIDHRVFDSIESHELTKQVHFEKSPILYEMNCKIFPLLNESDQISGLFGIGTGQMIIPSGLQNIFLFVNKMHIAQIIKKPRYLIRSKQLTVFLTRREVACLLYLMKGKTAKEVAGEMSITSRTAENYIAIIKEKFGCYSKSQLICLAFESTLIEEILKFEDHETKFSVEKIQSINRLYNKDKQIFIKI